MPSLAVEWPDFPVIHIVTIDSVMPSRDILEAPEGCIGTGITNNDYVGGSMVMTLRGDTLYASGDYVKGQAGMRIKIRGNSSGAYVEQKPYKLKLSKKADLLQRGDKAFRHKHWALLSLYMWNPVMTNGENNILTMLGTEVCRAVGMPWTPVGKFVNVEINGNYCGMYYLVETVERGDTRVPVEDSGFLIENDAYWWNADGFYFKTPHQHPFMGYTYKYPEADEEEPEELQYVESFMTAFEDSLYGGGNLAQMADMRSFARWVLAHDVLGTLDAGGSNMFLYKKDYDATNPYASPLSMATPWDFDSSLRVDSTAWSAVHELPVFYYPELFKRPEFVEAYVSLWNEVGDSVYARVSHALNAYADSCAEEFDKSTALHRTVYPYQGRTPLREQVAEVLGKLHARLDRLPSMVDVVAGISSVGIERKCGNTVLYDLSGRMHPADASHLPSGIYVERKSDGKVAKRIIK